MKVIIEVTKLDIEQGKKTLHDECAIALATSRALNLTGDRRVSVTKSNILVTAGPKLTVNDPKYSISEEVKSFITKYDKGEEVQPFSFEIET